MSSTGKSKDGRENFQKIENVTHGFVISCCLLNHTKLSGLKEQFYYLSRYFRLTVLSWVILLIHMMSYGAEATGSFDWAGKSN